jgi:O-acetyl-ADP-ribose deacetylase (regulator of RNase III)
MITYVVCDLFTSPAQTLVNTVNTVGVMGKGIAKDFKAIYPEMFTRYQELCERDQFNIGQLWPYRTSNKLVLNFPTKQHWRSPSRPEYIEAGLKTFAAQYHIYGVTSISFPLLGCGNGELDWESQVRPLMEGYLGKLPIDVYIHLQNRQDPYTPEHRNLKQMKKWLQGEPESLAFNEVWADLIVAIASDPHCVAIGTGESFGIRIGGEENSIILELGHETIEIPQDVFLDLWQILRAAGFLGHDYLPRGLSDYSDFIIPLMTKLPYISQVNMAEQSDQPSRLSVGLRIAPGTEGFKRPQLFSLFSMGAVEPE